MIFALLQEHIRSCACCRGLIDARRSALGRNLRAAAGAGAQVVCFKICIVRLGGEAVAGGDPMRRDEARRRSSRVQPPAGGQAPAPSSRGSTGCAAPLPDKTEHCASQA